MNELMTYEQVLRVLSSRTPDADKIIRLLDSELSMPNIPLKTMGGEVFWNNIIEYNGWKLQQNMITHHARILDDNNVRRAWGTINGMQKARNRIVAGMTQYKESENTSSSNRMNAMQELKQLKELFDIGAITESEYNEKKKRLMEKF